MRHGWLVQEVTPQVLAAATGAGVHGLYPRADASTAEGIAAARGAGLSVRAWGVRHLPVTAPPAQLLLPKHCLAGARPALHRLVLHF